MDQTNQLFIVKNMTFLFIAIGLTIVAVLILVSAEIKRKHITIIEKMSCKLSKVNWLNQNTTFWDIPNQFEFKKNCISKAEYDRTTFDGFLFQCLERDSEYYREIIRYADENKAVYGDYCSQLDDILSESTEKDKDNYAKYRFFEKVERRICNEHRAEKPTTDVQAHISKKYVSPKGRNSYHADATIKQPQIIECLNEIERIKLYKESTKYQREMMTPSLRYDVFKRDGFKCVLCGASAKDGVRLCVDHIRPVSKGGKTEIGNLRTLCFTCNAGKAAKYDLSGEN